MAKSYDFKKAVELVSLFLSDQQRQKDFGKIEYAELLLFEDPYNWRTTIPIYCDGKFDKINEMNDWFEYYTPTLVIVYERGESDFINCYIEK